jgi:hypothetical protein
MAAAKFVNRDKILARFAKMPASVQATAGSTLKVQVDDLLAALKRAAPVSPLEGTPGELRDTIEVYANESRVLSFRIIAAAKDSKGRFYGRYVEFGHTAADGVFIAAQPFWFSTYRAWKRGMVAAIRRAVRDQLKAEFPEFFK